MTAIITAGMTLTPARLNDLVAVKSADETVASSTAFQNDDHLSVSVVAATYLLELEGIQNSAVAAGMKMLFSTPSGTTGTLAGLDGGTPFAGVTIATTLVFGGVATNENFKIWGRVVVTTAGTFRLTWAQNASNATGSILRASTYLRLTRVA